MNEEHEIPDTARRDGARMSMSSVQRVMSTATGVVFDKDGTLVDLDARWVPVFVAFVGALVDHSDDPGLGAVLVRELGIDGERLVPDGPAAVEALAQITDRVVGRLVERAHEPTAARALVEAALGGLEQAHGPITPIGDIAGALTALRAAGLRIGLATSDDRANTRAELIELGIADLVDTQRCADDGGPIKPDPRVLTGVAAEWGHGVGDLVFVGDSANDMATARAAGCAFIARCDRGRVPSWADDADAVVGSIAELVPA